jgi:uncharacterized membrane protein
MSGPGSRPTAAIIRDLVVSQVDVTVAKNAQTTAHKEALSVAESQVSGSAAALRVTEYSSPLPPPDVLELYERQQPGLSGAIIEEWKAQQTHQRDFERRQVENEHLAKRDRQVTERTRIWLAFILALAGLLAIAALGMQGKTVPATVVAALEALGGWALWKRLGRGGSESP